MKKNVSHIITLAVLSGLFFAQAVGVLFGQTPIGTRIDNRATARFGYFGGKADSVLTNVASVTVSGRIGFTLLKSVSPQLVAPGDTVVYSIVIADTGSADLSHVLVVDTVSSSFAVIGVTRGSFAGSVVKWNVPTIPSGGKDTLKITALLQTNLPAGSVVTNKALGVDSAGTSIVASVDCSVKAAPRLDIQKNVTKASVNGGDTVIYTIIMKNSGNQTLTHLVLTDTIPSSLSLAGLSPNAAAAGPVAGSVADSIGVGMADTVRVSAVVGNNLPGGLQIVNVARATSDQTSMVSGTASSTVLVRPSLSLTKTVASDTAKYGDTLRYTITYRNTGNVTLTHLTVADSIIPGLSFVSASPAGIVQNNNFLIHQDSLRAGRADSLFLFTRVVSYKTGGGVIRNIASVICDQTPEQTAQALVTVNATPSFTIAKSVAHDTVIVGDTVRYSVVVRNTGTIPLTAFTVIDTLPGVLVNPPVKSNAVVTNGIAWYTKDTLWMGAADTVTITAQVAFGTQPKSVVLNRAWASAAEAAGNSATAFFVTAASPASNSCRLAVSANPVVVRGDGVNSSVITAFYSDSAGHPKPDGTPVLFISPVGTFTNGRDSSTRYTVAGVVSDSLRLLVTGQSQVAANVVISASDSSLCYAADTVVITFDPGAISGTVFDRKTGQPVGGASVSVLNSSDTVVGVQSTLINGSFLIPVPASGLYSVRTITVDQFHRTVDTKTTQVVVDLSSPGQKPPFTNRNSLSGRIYDPNLNQPVDKAGMRVYLSDAQTHSITDSTFTDSTGLFFFGNLPVGSFIVRAADALRQGQNSCTNGGGGEYVVDVDIPLTAVSSVVLTKTGPARAYAGDTAVYQIHLANRNASALGAFSLIDTLDRSMNFIAASSGATYDATGNRVTWSLPGLDSMSVHDCTVTVSFADSVANGTLAVNRVSLNSNDIPQLSAFAKTTILIPAKLTVMKTVSSEKAVPGDTLSYTIAVANISTVTADSVVVTDRIPVQLAYVSSVPAGKYNPVTGILSWTVDSLTAGSQVKMKLAARVRNDLTAGEYSFTNSADVRWPGGEISSLQNAQSKATVDLLVPFIAIHKQAVHRIVEIGDAAIYTIRVANISAGTTAFGLSIRDIVPLGFRYIAGSSFRDSVKISDPSGTKELTWNVADSLQPGASWTLTYRLVVGAGALDGNGVNTAQCVAHTGDGSAVVSNISQDQVQINRGVFSDHGLVIGKVFYDDNENKEQDPGEEGVKGIELLTEDGTRVTTGDDGKYSLPDVQPGEHVIRVRQSSLPHGAELVAGYGEFAQEPSSRFVRVPESGISRVDFYLRRSAPEPVLTTQKIAKFGSVTVRRISNPKNIRFVNDETTAPVRLRGTQFDPGKAVLKADAFPTLKAVADLAREFPRQTIAISGHTDSIRIRTKEFPSNNELSEARANAVKEYLVSKEHIDAARISTIGFGERTPIAPNSTKAGRAQNRRVEVTLSEPAKVFDSYLRTVEVTIPVSYDGAVPIGQIELRDRLDTTLHFVPGSGRIGATSLTPKIENGILHWTINGVGNSYTGMLSYRLSVTIPAEEKIIAHSSTEASYVLPSGKIVVVGELNCTTVIRRTVRVKPVNFTLPGALFEAGKAEVKPEAIPALNDAAETLKNYPEAMVNVDGFTDSRPVKHGEFPSNVALSNARAKSVAQMLISRCGIEQSRVTAYGWGELKPVASNESEKGRAANRRVEIRIYRSEKPSDSTSESDSDSSSVLKYRVDDMSENLRFDSSATDVPGDRILVEVKVRRSGERRPMSGFVVDSLPPAVSVIDSASKMYGIESIRTVGRIITAKISQADSVAVFRYTIEMNEIEQLPSSGHAVEIVRTSAGGREFVNRFRLPLLRAK